MTEYGNWRLEYRVGLPNELYKDYCREHGPKPEALECEIKQWCIENIKIGFAGMHRLWTFDNSDDAAFFILRWGGRLQMKPGHWTIDKPLTYARLGEYR